MIEKLLPPELPKEELNKEKNYLLLFFSIVATVFSLILSSIIIIKTYKPIDLSSQIPLLFVDSLSDFKPELKERALYISWLLLTPVFLLSWFFIFKRFVIDKLKNKNIIEICFKTITILLSIFLAGSFFLGIIANPIYLGLVHQFISFTQIFILLIFSVIFSLILIYKKNSITEKIINVVSKPLAYIITLIVPLLGIFNIYNIRGQYAYSLHFNCVFHTVSQVFLGKELLFNLTSQYGLYPHFLNPVFKIIGLSVFKFSLIMSILIVISYYALLKFLEESINKKYLIYIGYIALLFITYFLMKPVNFEDVYFQYIPIRFIFPALSIFMTWKYFNTKSKILYFLSFIIYSAAILWNIDTGLVIFIGWLLALIYEEFVDSPKKYLIKNIIKNIFIAVLTVLSVFLLYDVFMKITCGHFIDYTKMLRAQSIFYKYGFYMLPMKLIHPWNLLILSYIAGLGISVKNLFNHKALPVDKSIFYLSVIGFGLFSYFQGRSHNYCIFAVIYPAILLSIIFTDKILKTENIMTQFFYKSIAVFPVCLFIFFNLALIYELPAISQFTYDKFNISFNTKETYLTKNIDFLKANIKPKEKAIILSYYSGIYYLATKADSPLNLPGPSEVFTKKDYQQLYDFLNTYNKTKIIMDNEFEITFPSAAKEKIFEILSKKKKKIKHNYCRSITIFE